MKIMTVLGTRPEIIRLSRIIPLLDRFAEKHVLVHTGQNFDQRLSELFFAELGVRSPDINLAVRGASAGEQIGKIIQGFEKVLLQEKPDRVLILGDTNSGLSALMARRHGVPVYHMEAGNRCYDDRVPEEVNRRVIDQCSTVLMPYTERSRQNLLREGIAGENILVTGNPIREVITSYRDRIDASTILEDMGLKRREFFLVTVHRSENVDISSRLHSLMNGLKGLADSYGHPVLCSVHPRTKEKIAKFGVDVDHAGFRFVEPFGFFDFIRLEEYAFCVLSDSGTVQEEACLFQTPNVTLRDVTERPETLEGGSNVLGSCDPERILTLVDFVTSRRHEWRVPTEYLAENVAETVMGIVLGHRTLDAAGEDWSLGSKS